MTDEAGGYADLGLWQEAWDALEALPPEERATPAALRARLRCCPGLGSWDVGEYVAKLLSDGGKADRASAAAFYMLLAVYHAKSGNREPAEEAIGKAVSAWPEIRADLIDEPALREVIF